MGILELTPSVIYGLCQFSHGDRLFGESSGHEAARPRMRPVFGVVTQPSAIPSRAPDNDRNHKVFRHPLADALRATCCGRY